MIGRGDERGVSALVGAVLLLGIFVTALALYQVNVVPEQNAEVEFNHNERAAGEMQELRNAITNTDRASATRSSSVQLGAQYPDRWLTINPPSPTGTISTQSGTIEFENLEVANENEYTGPVDGLLNDQDTNTLSYEPNYNEYQQAPITHIEHSLVFNDFDPELVELTDQQLVDGTDLNLVIVDGEVSESSSGVASIDVRTVSGPSVPVDIKAEDGATITLPTANADAWEESESLEEESNVTRVSGNGGSVEIELEEGEYSIQMTCVTVGSGGSLCDSDPFDIDRTAEEGDGAAFATVWDEQKDDALTEASSDDVDYFIEEGDSATLTLETKPTASGVPITFGEDDSGLTLEDPQPTQGNNPLTREDGTAEVTLETNDISEGENGTVYVWSGGSGDRLVFEVGEADEGDEEDGDDDDDSDNGDDDDSTEEQPSFSEIGADAEVSGGDRIMTVNWNIDGDFETVEIEVRASDNNDLADAESSTERSGEVVLDNDVPGGGDSDVIVTVSGPSGEETCTAEDIQQNGDADTDDFSCE